ncbi:hypothetical protein Tco_1226523 [Tanacetum coccineum]
MYQVQRLMEAHLAPKSSVQVNKIASLCEIYSGPYDTQYCMENPKQAFVEYPSLRTDEVGGKQFTTNQGPRSFNEATNAWKDKSNFNWARTQTFTSPQNGSFSTYSSNHQTKLERVLSDFDSHQEKRLSSLGTQLKQQQDDVINKINTLWKVISEKFDNAPAHDNVGDFMARVNAISVYHPESTIESDVAEDNGHDTIVEGEKEIEEGLDSSKPVIEEDDIWEALGGNICDLDSIWKETGQDYNFTQSGFKNARTVPGDGVANSKRRCQNLQATASRLM